MEENKNLVLDIIIAFVKGFKSEGEVIQTNYNGVTYKIHSCRYLLNQILRQWHTPKERYYVSKRAMQLWEKLSKDDIGNYYYNNIVTCECEEPIKVRIYTGSSNNFENRILNKGDKFKFNSVFHEEHIIPINVIIDQLCNLQELTYSNVEKILNKISICRILKEEDKMLNANHSKKHRPCDVEDVLNNIYRKVGIEVVKS